VRHAGDPEPILADGAWHGTIVDEPRGTGGFGYDPHFEDAATGMTGAELPLAQKSELSHRGKAMRALIAKLAETMSATAEGAGPWTASAHDSPGPATRQFELDRRRGGPQ
jgi:XTP/dITP diphosphohydrolase